MEEKALEIYYRDALSCIGSDDQPQLTTLDTESPGGNLLVPALFEMRYQCGLIEYVAEKEAKWLPVWRAREEVPRALAMFNTLTGIKRDAGASSGRDSAQ